MFTQRQTQKINEALLDSLLKFELTAQGINAKYRHTISTCTRRIKTNNLRS